MNRRVAFLLGAIFGYEACSRMMQYALRHDPTIADKAAQRYGSKSTIEGVLRAHGWKEVDPIVTGTRRFEGVGRYDWVNMYVASLSAESLDAAITASTASLAADGLS